MSHVVMIMVTIWVHHLIDGLVWEQSKIHTRQHLRNRDINMLCDGNGLDKTTWR